MAGVELRSITKSFGATPVLKGVTLSIPNGEFLTLLGPSGCGKSTLLRIIAGLERHDEGSVAIGDTIVDALRPKERDIAMVFQSYALYPHMTVAQNLAVPLRMRRLNRWQRLPLVGRHLPGAGAVNRDIQRDVTQTATALGMDHLLERKPAQLSGGQRQRVAVGRAMVRHPAVFLMDEPLSNLDAKLRVAMRAEIKELHQRLGITFIYVTHDQTEAMTMSDRVAVMLDGELIQVAPPREIYADPADRRVAEFIGSPKINLLTGIVRGDGAVDAAGATIAIRVPLAAGEPVLLGVRPEAFHAIERPAESALTGKVRLVEHLGADVFVHLDLPGEADPVIARFPAGAGSVERGQTLHVGVDPGQILLFSHDGTRLRRSDGSRANLRSLGR